MFFLIFLKFSFLIILIMVNHPDSSAGSTAKSSEFLPALAKADFESEPRKVKMMTIVMLVLLVIMVMVMVMVLFPDGQFGAGCGEKPGVAERGDPRHSSMDNTATRFLTTHHHISVTYNS